MDDFDKVMEFIFKWEGGYVNDPADPGGETNFGIAKRSHPDLDIKNLTKDQAKEIYKIEYWNKIYGRGGRISDQAFLMDTAVNMGVTQAVIFWKTMEDLLGTAEREPDISDLTTLRRARYFELIVMNNNLAKFAHGWNNRLVDLEKTFNA